MKKDAIVGTVSTIIFFLLFSPFMMPERITYIKNAQIIYNPAWEIMAYTASVLLLLFSFAGIYVATEFIYNKINSK